jgi:hypothetical protein
MPQANLADTSASSGYFEIPRREFGKSILVSARARGDGFNFWPFAVCSVLSFLLFPMVKFMKRYKFLQTTANELRAIAIHFGYSFHFRLPFPSPFQWSQAMTGADCVLNWCCQFPDDAQYRGENKAGRLVVTWHNKFCYCSARTR